MARRLCWARKGATALGPTATWTEAPVPAVVRPDRESEGSRELRCAQIDFVVIEYDVIEGDILQPHVGCIKLICHVQYGLTAGHDASAVRAEYHPFTLIRFQLV